jgi:hypothetical protein
MPSAALPSWTTQALPRVAFRSTPSPPSDPCACSRTYNLQCEQGATLSSKITLTLNGVPVDVTGGHFQFTAKLDPSLPDSDPSTIKIDWQETSTPTQGVTWLVIPADTTSTMQVAGYSYQVRLVSSGGVVTPLVKGMLTILQPISARH